MYFEFTPKYILMYVEKTGIYELMYSINTL